MPENTDLALLFLRVSFALPLLLKHGLEKVTGFSQMSKHFPDPLHIGPVPSLLIALVSDFICSILVLLGFRTRIASLVIFLNILVAWIFVHHFEFFGRGADHGELIVLYLGASAAICLAGAGRLSVDGQRS